MNLVPCTMYTLTTMSPISIVHIQMFQFLFAEERGREGWREGDREMRRERDRRVSSMPEAFYLMV